MCQVNYYSQLSGQPREKVLRDLDRDNFLSAQEAKDYGLVDAVIQRTGSDLLEVKESYPGTLG